MNLDTIFFFFLVQIGRSRSEETKDKIRKSMQGRTVSPEVAEKIGMTRRASHWKAIEEELSDVCKDDQFEKKSRTGNFNRDMTKTMETLRKRREEKLLEDLLPKHLRHS